MSPEEKIRLLTKELEKANHQNRLLGDELCKMEKEAEDLRKQLLEFNASKLKSQQKFYEDILNNLPEDIAVLDENERYLFVNPLGIKDPELRKQIIGKNDKEYAQFRGKNDSIAEERKQMIQFIRETGQTVQWEEEFRLPDGSVEHFHRKMFPINDEKGNLRFFVGYGLNISDRKKIEKRASDLLKALEKVGDNIWEYDTKTSTLIVTKQNLKLPHFVEDREVIRQFWENNIHPDDVELVRELNIQYNSGLIDQHAIEYRMLDETGGYKWILDRGIVIETTLDKKPAKILGIHTDITYIKQLQLDWERTSKRYHDLIEYSLALIFTHDLEGQLLSVNPAVRNTLGYPENEIVGRNIREFLPPLFNAALIQQYERMLNTTGKAEGVIRVVSKTGQKNYLLCQNYKRLDEQGQPYVICFAQDITKRILAEKELVVAKKHSEDVARAKENFLANMSHEIRTPMNGVMGIATLLAKTKLDEQQKHYLNLIQESSQNLLMIVNDVLDLEKIVLGKLQFENKIFSLSERVEMCVQSFTYKALEKGLEMLYLNNLQENICVFSDPYRLSQLLNNLISNAVKFTERGSVIIETNLLKQDGNQWMIEFCISDTGIGIPEERLAEIFEPFVQASASVSRMYGGTGLGLSICNQLIKMMGGRFEVRSILGEGSTFRFAIPFEISALQPEEKTPPQEIAFGSLGSLRALVVEDVELNQYLARHIMEGWGFVVDVANNGKEAVDLVGIKDYDFILMDIQMPVMNGLEATAVIRNLEDPIKKSIPIIALTANALKGDSEQYLSAGMNDYLTKPFDEEKLYAKVVSTHERCGRETACSGYFNSIKTKQKQVNELFDLAVIRSMSGGDEEFIQNLLSMFIATMPGYLEEMKNYMLGKDWMNTSRAAHKIKASIHTMAITSLYETIQAIEDQGKSRGSKQGIPGMVEEVNKVVGQVIEEMQKILNRSN